MSIQPRKVSLTALMATLVAAKFKLLFPSSCYLETPHTDGVKQSILNRTMNKLTQRLERSHGYTLSVRDDQQINLRVVGSGSV